MSAIEKVVYTIYREEEIHGRGMTFIHGLDVGENWVCENEPGETCSVIAKVENSVVLHVFWPYNNTSSLEILEYNE